MPPRVTTLLEFTQHVSFKKQTNYVAACNAAETLLVHEAAASRVLPAVAARLTSLNVQLRCDAASLTLLSSSDNVPKDKLTAATDEDFDTEFLELIMAVKIVPSITDAIQHINSHGSHHTDAIITEDESSAEKFMSEVDSAGVYWNASTRFADGFRYGFGAEIGVSFFKAFPSFPFRPRLTLPVPFSNPGLDKQNSRAWTGRPGGHGYLQVQGLRIRSRCGNLLERQTQVCPRVGRGGGGTEKAQTFERC